MRYHLFVKDIFASELQAGACKYIVLHECIETDNIQLYLSNRFGIEYKFGVHLFDWTQAANYKNGKNGLCLFRFASKFVNHSIVYWACTFPEFE